jgi:AraC-like DNA-binding protein
METVEYTERNDEFHDINLEKYERKYHVAPAIRFFSYFPAKSHSIHRVWPVSEPYPCVSFVLEGNGFMHINGTMYASQAPFVFVEIPGNTFQYGPHKTWVQFYFLPMQKPKEFLRHWKLGTPDSWVWPMRCCGDIRAIFDEMVLLTKYPGIPGVADRIDHCAQRALLLSIVGEPRIEDPLMQRIHDAEKYIRNNYRSSLSLPGIARNHLFSVSAFYRYWNRAFTVSPSALIIRLRLEYAARLLEQTSESIKSICRKAGFSGAQYFSRRFAGKYGCAPGAYRAARTALPSKS